MDPLLIITFIAILVIFIILAMIIISKLKGKIKIELEKYEFSRDQQIKGKIVLNLKRSLPAKHLSVGIVAIQRQTTYSAKGIDIRNHQVFDFYKQISGERVYPAGVSVYPFSFNIPSDCFQVNSIGKAITKTLDALSGQGQKKWFVRSFLEIKGINIDKKVRVIFY